MATFLDQQSDQLNKVREHNVYIYIYIYDHIFDKTLKNSKSSEQYDYLHGKTAASFPHEFFLKDFRYL